MTVRDKLMELQDLKYADFQRKLMPTVQAEKVIGVRTPQLRRLQRSSRVPMKQRLSSKNSPMSFLMKTSCTLSS